MTPPTNKESGTGSYQAEVAMKILFLPEFLKVFRLQQIWHQMVVSPNLGLFQMKCKSSKEPAVLNNLFSGNLCSFG